MRTTWTTKDGRRLSVAAMSDEHLVATLRMGLRAESRRQREEALDNLTAAYSVGNDADEYGDLVYDEAIRKAYSIQALKAKLATTPRYAPIVAEVEKRGLRLTRRKVSRAH